MRKVYFVKSLFMAIMAISLSFSARSEESAQPVDRRSAITQLAAKCLADPASAPSNLLASELKAYCDCMSVDQAALQVAGVGSAIQDGMLPQMKSQCVTRVRSGAQASQPADAVTSAPVVANPPSQTAVAVRTTSAQNEEWVRAVQAKKLSKQDYVDILTKASNSSGIPLDIAQASVLDCTTKIKARHPKATPEVMALACGCFAGQLASLKAATSNEPEAGRQAKFDQLVNAAVETCEGRAISAIASDSRWYQITRSAVLPECRKRKSGFGVSSESEASQLCECLMDGAQASSPRLLAQYIHFGDEAEFHRSLEGTVQACKTKLAPVKLDGYPFSGKWRTSVKKCNSPQEEDDYEFFEFRGNERLEYETGCKAKSVQKSGNIVYVVEQCESQEETETQKITFEIIDDMTLALSVNKHKSVWHKCN